MIEIERVCVLCNLVRPITEFHRNPKSLRGRIRRCTRCIKRKRTPEVNRRVFLKTQYDMTLEQFAALSKSQQDACAICHIKPPQLFVDHNHKTGKVRGLLCDYCNKGLGFFRDNPKLLVSAISYLRPVVELVA